MEKKKSIALVIGILLIVKALLIIDTGFEIFFSHHYFFNTTINGVEVGGKTVSDARHMVEGLAEDYEIELRLRDDKKEVITGREIDFTYKAASDLKKIQKQQNHLLWYSCLWQPCKYDIEMVGHYDDEMLIRRIDALHCMNVEMSHKPENAAICNGGGLYSIKEGNPGTLVDSSKIRQAVRSAINKQERCLDVEEAQCYQEAPIDVNNLELISLKNSLNRYLSSKITYDFGDTTEVIDISKLNNWIHYVPKYTSLGTLLINDKLGAKLGTVLADNSLGTVLIDEVAIKAYVEELGDKYDTLGKTRQFKTSAGDIIEVTGGDYGWRINRQEETKALIELIEQGDVQCTRRPIYSQEAYCRGVNDVGDSYVEVDLSKQYLWCYKEGKLVTQGSIVSGNQDALHATPVGTYDIDYKKPNAILRGPGYACPVRYWIPFNNGIGIHDATWRGKFGGEIYLHDGSHGCINTPFDVVGIVFESVEKGMPVICYKR